MKYIYPTIIGILLIAIAFVYFSGNSIFGAAPVFKIYQGGTGTSTPPSSYGEMFVWDGIRWSYQATSSLNITATASSDSTWTDHNDYPAACGAGNFVSAIGDTLTCSVPTGGGTIATSSAPTIGNLSYWTDWNKLGTVATTTLTGTWPVVFSQPISVIGSSASALSIAANSFLATTTIDTSAELAAILGDETGTAGSAVFSSSPTLTGLLTFANASGTQLTTTGSTYLATTDGNVGIGTTGPGYKLDVNGGINASSAAGAGYNIANTQVLYYGGGVMNINDLGGGFALRTGGVSRLYADTNGNIGVGNQTPSYILDVVPPSGTATDLFRVASSTGSVGMVIKNNGNVGIGTTGPGYKLHVVGNTYLEGSTYSGPLYASNHYGVNFGTYNWLNGDTNVKTQTGYNITLRDGSNEFMRISSSGNVGIGTTSPGAKLSITGSGTGTGLAFAVADSGNSPKVVIQDDGNVGIGTTSPASLLNINSTLPRFYISDSDATANNKHWFFENNGGVLGFGTTTDALGVTNTRALTISNAGILTFGKSKIDYNYIMDSIDLTVGTSTSSGGRFRIFLGSTGSDANSKFQILNPSGATELFAVDYLGDFAVGGTATSTMAGNLDVAGSVEAAYLYTGDLVFSNGFRFKETDNTIYIENAQGKKIWEIDNNGKLILEKVEVNTENIKNEIMQEMFDWSLWEKIKWLFGIK